MQADPARTTLRFVPSPGQLAFCQDRYAVPERLMSCGTGGGKTYTDLFEVVDWSLENGRDGTVLFGLPNVPMIKKVVPETWRQLTGHELGARGTLGEDWNKSDRLLTLPNGWKVWFVTVEDPQNIEGPPSADLVVLDEARVVRRLVGEDGAWSQLTRRLRGKADTGRRRGAVMSTHSPSKAVMSIFAPAKGKAARYRAPGPLGQVGRFTVRQCVDAKRRIYEWSMLDAAAWRTLDPKDAERIASDYPVGSAAYTRVILGQHALPSGRVYDQFTEARNVRPWDGKRGDRMEASVDLGWDHDLAVTVHSWRGQSVHTVAEVDMSQHGRGLQGLVKAAPHVVAKYGVRLFHVGTDVRMTEAITELQRLRIPAVPFLGRVEDRIMVANRRLAARSWLVDPRCVNVIRQLEEQERDERTGDPVRVDDDYADSATYGVVGGGSGGATAGAW